MIFVQALNTKAYFSLLLDSYKAVLILLYENLRLKGIISVLVLDIVAKYLPT